MRHRLSFVDYEPDGRIIDGWRRNEVIGWCENIKIGQSRAEEMIASVRSSKNEAEMVRVIRDASTHRNGTFEGFIAKITETML